MLLHTNALQMYLDEKVTLFLTSLTSNSQHPTQSAELTLPYCLQLILSREGLQECVDAAY